MVHALETEPELFIRTQQFLPYFKELKESQYTFDIQKNKKTKQKQENENS